MAGFSDHVAAVDSACRAHLTDPAFWRPGGVEPGVLVPVMFEEPDINLDFGQSRAVSASVVIQVFKADFAAPARDDVVQLQADGRLFKLIARPMLDPEGTLWSCEAAPVAP